MRRKSPSLVRGLADLFATRPLDELIQKATKLWRREGLKGVRRAFFTIGRFQLSYSRWVNAYDVLSATDRDLIREHIGTFEKVPVISILLKINSSRINQSRLITQSIVKQLYPHWELYIIPGISMSAPMENFLSELQQSDHRIKVVSRSAADSPLPTVLNAALTLATGEFLALLGPEDELSEHALYMVAAAINCNREIALLYGDEDRIDERGQRFSPYFKPDWNPDLFFTQNYLGSFAVYHTELVRSLDGFNESAKEACDWGLALRVTERVEQARIHHIPHVLSHKHSMNEPAMAETGLRAVEDMAAIRVLEGYWRYHGLRVSIEPLDCGHFRTIFPLPDPPPLVSIIIPTRNGLALLRRCLEGLFHHTDYPNKEIIVVDNNSDDPATIDYLSELAGAGHIRLLKYDAPFNYSAINNMAVSHATGELICLLNNDVEPINPGWMGEMVSHATRQDIGAVGAMLYYPDDTIQHAGVALNGIVAGHLYVGFPRGYTGEACRGKLVQNLSAVTAACLIVRREVWKEAGGMDQENLTVAFNDVDFCLKVRELGYRNLWTPFAELYHHESASRGREDTPDKLARVRNEIACMQQRWGKLLGRDPAWNPNLELDSSWPRPAHPPRSEKPWRHSNRPQS